MPSDCLDPQKIVARNPEVVGRDVPQVMKVKVLNSCRLNGFIPFKFEVPRIGINGPSVISDQPSCSVELLHFLEKLTKFGMYGYGFIQ